MNKENNKEGQSDALRVIISGGGTGGHIFPAVSIANAIKELRPDAQILFVGAEGRMEMQRVPDAGYQIIGLPVAGFDRKHLWKNVAVLLKLVRSQWKARKHYPAIPSSGSSRSRRICKRSYFKNGGNDGSTYFNTRAEFIRRSNQ